MGLLSREYDIRSDRRIRSYCVTLSNFHCRYGLALTPVYGVSQAILILGYIIAFRYGAWQVTLDESSIAFSHFSNVLQVFTAIVFASVSIGLSNSLAPDYVAAKLSAKKIMALLERTPKPDGFSEDGTKLVRNVYTLPTLNRN